MPCNVFGGVHNEVKDYKTVGSILVIGSINYDYLFTQERLPRRGETFPASSMEGAFGGKGANQAVQAARLGGDVRFLGAVGDDDTGSKSRRNLEAHSIVTTLDDSSATTGTAAVHITQSGEVYATIFEGANRVVDADFVNRHQRDIADAQILILQNEIPAGANARAIDLAHRAGIPVIYNAAPARAVEKAVSSLCTWFVVNEDEAGFYLEEPLGDARDIEAMKAAAHRLRAYGRGVILTLGSHGSIVATDSGSTFIPARPVRAKDTTGAGDSFVGAFAVALLEGKSAVVAASGAALVASLTVMGVGAQSSMPMREDIPHEVVFETPPDPSEDQ